MHYSFLRCILCSINPYAHLKVVICRRPFAVCHLPPTMPCIGPAPMAEVNELPYLIFTLTLIDRNNNLGTLHLTKSVSTNERLRTHASTLLATTIRPAVYSSLDRCCHNRLLPIPQSPSAVNNVESILTARGSCFTTSRERSRGSVNNLTPIPMGGIRSNMPRRSNPQVINTQRLDQPNTTRNPILHPQIDYASTIKT